MKRITFSSLFLILIAFAHIASAGVTPVENGYRISYNINLGHGTSNGSDIQDTLIFEWNAGGDFSVEPGATIFGHGHTRLVHEIGFRPDSALVIGWGAAVPGVGDEKDHLFTLANSSFTRQVTGKKWSVAFPGVAPLPRTGHSAIIGLLVAAASGDAGALDSLTEFVQREAGAAAFDPANRFRVIEWTIARPIDNTPPVPTLSLLGFGLLLFGLLIMARRFIKNRAGYI